MPYDAPALAPGEPFPNLAPPRRKLAAFLPSLRIVMNRNYAPHGLNRSAV